MKLINRLWNMSPNQFTRAIRRRIRLDRSADDPRPAWHRVVAGPLTGAELYLAVEEDATWRAMIAGDHDRFLFDASTPRGPLDGKVCWDVGTHVGYHSLMFAALVGPGGKVVSFEPNASNRERIEMHLARNPSLANRIAVKPIALSDANGTAVFRFSDDVERTYSSGGHLADASAPCDPQVYDSFRTTRVETATIDALVGSGQAPAPDLMKIDVEGAEGAVLRGGQGVIRGRRPLLLIEVHHILQMLEVSQLLGDWGYRIEVLNRDDASTGRCFIRAQGDPA